MACPFFFPTERADDIALPHPARLPLGAAWRGTCEASAEPYTPSTHELEACNLGYAQTCQRLPKERSCDAIRFGVVRNSSSLISLRYVLETAHQPAGDGSLEYDRSLGRWNSTYPEPRIQKMAKCFLESYLDRADRGTRPLRTLAEIPLQDSKEQTAEGTDLTQSTIHSVKT